MHCKKLLTANKKGKQDTDLVLTESSVHFGDMSNPDTAVSKSYETAVDVAIDGNKKRIY